MRQFLVIMAAALAIAGLIGAQAEEQGFGERVLRLQADQELALPARTAEKLAPPVLNTLLNYSHDPPLLLNARAALARYPVRAGRVLSLYGQEPEFRTILRAYGASVVPPIHYYLENESYTLYAKRYIGEQIQQLGETTDRLWSGGDGGAAPEPGGQSPLEEESGSFTPRQRGWYAVRFIQEDGHDFLGQFVLNDDGEVERVQTERLLEGTTGFFTNGLRNLERKSQEDEAIEGSDYFWAAVDLAAIAGAGKILRAGKAAARTSRASTSTARSGVMARAIARTGRIGVRVSKYGAIPATVVLAVRYPGAISGLLYDAAQLAGLPPRLVQVGGWALILMPLLFLAMLVTRLVIRPLTRMLQGVSAMLG